MLDSSRAEGDVGVIEYANTGYYVIVFHSRSDNSSYNGVSFRHILVQVDDADEDGEISDEERQSAEDEINEILDTWRAARGQRTASPSSPTAAATTPDPTDRAQAARRAASMSTSP